MKRFETLQEWQQYAKRTDDRVTRLQNSIHDRGWALAATVGIPRCGCSLHNASIDDELKGWCYRNPERLKVAKRAAHIVNDWSASELGRKLIAKAWQQFCAGKGWGQPAQRRD